jgi:hypothetical protein
VRLVLPYEAEGSPAKYLQAVSAIKPFVARYWFDVLVVICGALGIAIAVVHRGHLGGPEGPTWLDIVLMVVIVAPFLARRRYGFWALAAVPIAVGISSPLDPRLVPDNGVTFAAGLAVTFLFAQLRNVRQALQFESLLETMFTLAPDGKTNRKGMPNPLRLAVIARAHFDTVRLPQPPAWLQKAGLAMGAPLGRLLGYRETYTPAMNVPAIPAV